MSDSYPTIHDSLSVAQKEFMGCVEAHLDPPEHDDPTYVVESVWRARGDAMIRFALAVDESDPDFSARRHLIEFLSPDDPQRPVARVMHRMKRVEANRGHFVWTESQFHVAGPDVPDRTAPQAEVEHEVMDYVDRVRALDRARRLVEVAG